MRDESAGTANGVVGRALPWGGWTGVCYLDARR